MNENAEKRETTEAPESDMSTIYEEINPDLTQIEAYAKAKQAIARDLHYIRELLHKRNSERRDAKCRDLMAKLAEDHFTLAVLGQFKRGKSSLMNAIIGRPLLPTGVLPLTSAITVLRFGPHERLMIEHEGSRVIDEVPLSALSEYVTEKGNPGNRKHIARAVIEMPSPFLRRGLEFVDTPGVGSSIEANTAITQNFLPQCDAVIFITSVDSPLSKTEKEFLSQIREHVRKVFFVVNKTDLLGRSERDEVLQFISQNLRSIMDTESVRIFPLSCQNGLEAKAQGDLDRYARSGVKSFEETLSDFLSTQKLSAFLVSILDRAIAVADDELRDMEIEARAAEVSEEGIEANRVSLQRRLEQIRSVRERTLSEIRERVRTFIKENARQEMYAILEREEEIFRRDIYEAIVRHPWSMSYTVIREQTKESAKRLNESLDGWAAAVAENLWPTFQTLARHEIQVLILGLQEILKATTEILKLDETSLSESDEFKEVHIESDPLPLHPTSLEDEYTIPAVFGFLPVVLARKSLTEYCHRKVEQMLEKAKVAVCDSIVERSAEILDKTIARIGELAKDMEGRAEAIVAGRVPSSTGPNRNESPAKQYERLKELRARMSTLRDRILQAESPEASGIVAVPATFENESPVEVITSREPSPVLDDTDIARDLKTRGCAVCNHAYKTIFDFFAILQFELHGNETCQSHFAAEGGFCRLHTWQLAAIASPQGVSQGYPRLIDRMAQEIARVATGSGDPAESVLSLVQSSQHCRACQELRTAETGYLEQLTAFIQDLEGLTAYSRSQGLCLRHLALLLEHDLPQEIKSYLLRHTSRILSATAEDMQSFSLKRDALRRGLHNQDEDDAYMRALTRLAGARYLAMPWNTDTGEV